MPHVDSLRLIWDDLDAFVWQFFRNLNQDQYHSYFIIHVELTTVFFSVTHVF